MCMCKWKCKYHSFKTAFRLPRLPVPQCATFVWHLTFEAQPQDILVCDTQKMKTKDKGIVLYGQSSKKQNASSYCFFIVVLLGYTIVVLAYRLNHGIDSL